MKWLNDKDSVSQKELEKSKRDSWAAYNAAAASWAAVAVANHPAWAAVFATDASAGYNDATAAASYWVNEYFEITGEDRNEYLKELNK